MKNAIKLFLIIGMIAMLASCGDKDSFTIKGNIKGGEGKMLYLEELGPREKIFIDSIAIDQNGDFSYSYKPPYESFYNLHDSQNDFIMLLPEAGEEITLTGDYGELAVSYTVKGSSGSLELWQLLSYTNGCSDEIKELAALDSENRSMYGNNPEKYMEEKRKTDSVYLEVHNRASEYVKGFIDEHQGSLSTLIALYKEINAGHRLIDIRRNPEMFSYYEEVLEGLQENYPENPHTVNFANTVEQEKYQMGRELAEQ